MSTDKENEHRSELVISRVLRVGVGTSLLLVCAGTALSFVGKTPAYGSGASEVVRLVGPAGSFPRSAGWLTQGILHLNGQAIIVAGLIVLIMTPLIRVGVSIVAFARQRDHLYTAITATVFALLVLSFVLGKAG